MNNVGTARKRTATSATTKKKKEKPPKQRKKWFIDAGKKLKSMHAKRLTESVIDANNY